MPIIQKSPRVQMRSKVHPLNSSQVPIHSTSRHQLRDFKKHQVSSLLSQNMSISNFKMKFLVSKLAKRIKFLAPPLIKPENILEDWQQQLKEEQAILLKKDPDQFRKETLSQQISNRYQSYNIFTVCQGILLIFFYWMVTVSLVYHERILVQLAYLVILTSLIQIVVKIKIAWNQHELASTYELHWNDFVDPLVISLSAILMIIRYYVQNLPDELVFVAEITCIILQFGNIGRYFSFVTLYAEQNKKRKQLRIIELFGFTLFMAHVFALIMYSMQYITPAGEQSWIAKANLSGKPWYILYIYSFYWANTTMVTVGYGDLLPSNYVEVIITTMIQVVGTAIFGYMINVIGITVNEINKKNQQFQENEATIFKLKNHYNLSRELCYRMKNDLKKKESEKKETPLKNNEEQQFLEYVDGSLKDEFVLETNMRVIKKSIFFLTHFTVNFQNEIALKLIRRIYKPEETINIIDNNQRQLVIIDSGKVHIHLKKYHNYQQSTKLAKVIKMEEGKPTLNVIGYSSLILNRDLQLKYLTQENTTAYILKRSDMLESLGKSLLDFQGFNQLREKMQLCLKIQEIQAPSLKDYESHFIPNSYLVFKKFKNMSQKRNKTGRGERRSKRHLVTLKHYKDKTMLYIPSEKEEKDFIDIQSLMQIQDKLQKEINPHPSRNSKLMVMDQGKNFENFLKNYNLSVIAKEYENACMKKSYLNRAKMSTLKLRTKCFRGAL